jgi:isocitrate/isopropylmalate dehydrogenase
MMLDWLGTRYAVPEATAAATAIDQAVDDTLAAGHLTSDVGGGTATDAFGDRVVSALRERLR